jgi:hypothetical protein
MLIPVLLGTGAEYGKIRYWFENQHGIIVADSLRAI